MHDAVWAMNFRNQLFDTISSGHRIRGRTGELVGMPGKLLAENSASVALTSQVLGGEQSNSSMLFDNKFFLKLYRKLENGVNPDVEVTRFLTEKTDFPNVPAFVGALEY